MINRFLRSFLIVCLLFSMFLIIIEKGSGSGKDDILVLESKPQLGVWFEKLEPAFYAGFALRCQDPKRIHLHVGRGNQLRVTVVISQEAALFYAKDLWYRYLTYRELIDDGTLVLSQNWAFEEFERTIYEKKIEQLVDEEITLSVSQICSRNLNLLHELNPGRVFQIKIPIETAISNWLKEINADDKRSMTMQRSLDLVNAMLPTRLFVAELSTEQLFFLKNIIYEISEEDIPEQQEIINIKPLFLELFNNITGGIYDNDGYHFSFTEFTAIYPIGTLNDFTSYKGKKIPLYPAPGRRALTTHQRTKTVDHIPIIEIYSYFPWIPYMHVGTKLHNSFHTLWWQIDVYNTLFIPENWQSTIPKSRTGGQLHFLWLLSRGPMSHGCTHLNAGHISELRQILPSETKRLYLIDNFRNKSFLYDVFDINGDLQPEVMGVKYYITYSLKNKKPYRLRVIDRRKEYYEWLYAGDLSYDQNDNPYFREIQDAKFIGRKAKVGNTYKNIQLYEADFEPERIQFFEKVDIPFVRELRKTAVTFQR